MALTIEDGSIVTGANSYITVAEYNAWADARFGSGRSTAPADDTATEQLILRAMDYFETQSFKGAIVQEDQPLQFPRYGLVIDGYVKDSDEIPKEVKTSIYELAYANELSIGQLNTEERTVKREKIDGIEVEYADNSSSSDYSPAISMTMRKLLSNGGGMTSFRTFRV